MWLSISAHRSVVYLEIDNRQCYQQSTECFQSATDVAAFLGALATSGNLNVPYIEAVTSTCLSFSHKIFHTYTHTQTQCISVM